MAIDFICPTCNGTLRVGDESAGRVIRCGACQTMLRVPGEAIALPPPPPPPPLAAVPVAPPRARADEPRDPEPAANVELADELPEAEPLEAELEADTTPSAPTPTDEPRAAEPEEKSEPGRRSWDPDWNKPHDRPRDRDRDHADDRPRRRRRPPAPPPRGRGVLFWLVVLGGVFAFLTVGCCGGLYFVIPGAKWQKHESARGGFKVDLPAPPQTDFEKRAGGAPDPNMHTEGTVLFGRMEEFAIVYGDIPPFDRRSTASVLDEVVQGMKSSGDVQSVLRQEDITVGGFPAREVEFSAKGGGWYISRIIIADGRVYVLVAGGRFAKPGNANARRFMDSFEITDPKMKTAGQKRADAEKTAAEQQEQVRLAAEKAAAERVKAEAERLRVAQEQRMAEEARREKVRAANEMFLKSDKYDGPEVQASDDGPDRHVLSLVGREHGPGVRREAKYIYPGVPGDEVGLLVTAGAVFQKTLAKRDGYTLSGWVRVRDVPVIVFHIASKSDTVLLDVTVSKNQVVAQVAGPKRSELKHMWAGDEKWHHVAFVSDRNGSGSKVRLYFDGKLVDSGPNAALIPNPESVRIGWVPVRDYPEAVRIGWVPNKGSREPATDELVAAIDECVMIGRPLTDAEVAALAGRKVFPVAPAPRPVD